MDLTKLEHAFDERNFTIKAGVSIDTPPFMIITCMECFCAAFKGGITRVFDIVTRAMIDCVVFNFEGGLVSDFLCECIEIR